MRSSAAERRHVGQIRQRRQPAQLYREDQHSDRSDQELGHGDGRKRQHIEHAVEQRATEHRRVMPIVSAIGTETSVVSPASYQRVRQARRDQLADRQVVRQRTAEVAAHDMHEPLSVALQRQAGRDRTGGASAATCSGVAAWPSACCAASPGSRPVIANTMADTSQQREQREAKARGDESLRVWLSYGRLLGCKAATPRSPRRAIDCNRPAVRLRARRVRRT